MRHAFASRMIDRGISSTVLAALMGHESASITERRYVTFSTGNGPTTPCGRRWPRPPIDAVGGTVMCSP
jgi:hypothetical protein